ncbi:ABC transporter permease [Spirochaeta dissipatitropha]
MNNLQHAVDELFQQKLLYVVAVIQILFTLILISFIWQELQQVNATLEIMNSIKNPRMVHDLIELTGQEDWELRFAGADDRLERFHRFYRFLRNHTDFTFLTRWRSMVLTRGLGNNKFPHEYPAFMVDPHFFETMGLQLSSGAAFDPAEYWITGRSGPVPVVLGNSFNSEVRIGDVFILSLRSYEFQAIVVGFLEEESYMLYRTWDPIAGLDDVIFMPVFEIASFNRIERFGWVVMYTQQSLIVSDNPEESLRLVREEAARLDLVDYGFRSFQEAWEGRYSDLNETYSIYAMLILLIGGLSGFSLACTQVYRIVSQRHVYGIHVLCGAKKRDLFSRVFWENFIVVMTAFLLMLVFRESSRSDPVFILTIFSGLTGYALLVSTVPGFLIMNFRLSELIRRME